MREQLLQVVQAIPDCSFVEICRAVPGSRGGETLFYGAKRNLVLWVGLSVEVVQQLGQLQREGQIQYKRCSTAPYLVDGGVLALPVALRVRDYASPRWLPVLIYPRQNLQAKRP